MWVKICGTTSLEDALLAVDAGAEAVGFVFAKSKRKIAPEAVAEIVDQLPKGIEKVGVFATENPHEVEHFAACCRLTAAQLHRPFDPEMVRALDEEMGDRLKIIQVVAYDVSASEREAADARFEAELQAALAEPAVWAVLLDTAKGGVSGGSGTAFDWGRAASIVERVRPEGAQLIVAGGLQPENVGEAIARLQPWGVDVVSGVEVAAGRKDAEKVRAFVAAARSGRGRLSGA